MRDGFLFRIRPDRLTFSLDRLQDPQTAGRQGSAGGAVDAQYADLKRVAHYTSKVFGIFGYLRLSAQQYLILISEASLVGKLVGGEIYRVEKL